MNNQEWQRRLSTVIAVSALLFLSITGRLYQKTVIEHRSISEEAENQYTYRREVIGQRGDIFVKDESGRYYPLASNERRYQVLAVPNQIKDATKAAKSLADILQINEAELKQKFESKKAYIPPLKRNLTREDADKIAALKLKGIQLLPELTRIYPEQSLASQLLGFVNAEGDGKYGLEGSYDTLLKGTSGYEVGEKDTHGRLINIGEEVKAKDGAKLVLTIDREIQKYVETALAKAIEEYKADSGSVVIVEPKTGAIVALASFPTFNPNTYNEIPTESQAVFGNPVISSSWEPGSIMKPLIMALAIDKNLVQPDTKSVFAASVKVLNHTIYNSEKKAYGEESMTQVLENSDNVGMVWIAEKLGNDMQYEGLKKFGFGQAPDLPRMGNVSKGAIGNVKLWNDLTRATVSFGQGVATSPLQIVMAYAALANDGARMKPYIVAQASDDKGALTETKPTESERVVSKETSDKVKQMLEAVVINGHGKRAAVPGYRVGGKTGTAQVPKPGGGYYEDQYAGSFAGYFPLTEPKYAMLVKIDNPKTTKFAESSAAPTFGNIAGWILRQKQITPDKPL